MEIGEFELIEKIKNKIPIYSKNIIKGIGDDCAVLKKTDDRLEIITTDSLFESVHFDLRFISYRQLGFKSLAVNISDIASMGGEPEYFVISLGIPKNFSSFFIEEFYEGMSPLCNKFNISLIGGDTNSSPDKFVINITLVGSVSKDDIIYRDNAKVGDYIFVTGTVGDSALGLQLLLQNKQINNFNKDEVNFLIERHLMPTPQVEIGTLLAKNHIPSAMIDISDGLLGDLKHLLKPNNLGALIFQDNIPLSLAYKNIVNYYSDNYLKLALSGGEDYELLFTAPKEFLNKIDNLSNEVKITKIGEITSSGKIELIDNEGKRIIPNFNGYTHF